MQVVRVAVQNPNKPSSSAAAAEEGAEELSALGEEGSEEEEAGEELPEEEDQEGGAGTGGACMHACMQKRSHPSPTLSPNLHLFPPLVPPLTKQNLCQTLPSTAPHRPLGLCGRQVCAAPDRCEALGCQGAQGEREGRGRREGRRRRVHYQRLREGDQGGQQRMSPREEEEGERIYSPFGGRPSVVIRVVWRQRGRLKAQATGAFSTSLSLFSYCSHAIASLCVPCCFPPQLPGTRGRLVHDLSELEKSMKEVEEQEEDPLKPKSVRAKARAVEAAKGTTVVEVSGRSGGGISSRRFLSHSLTHSHILLFTFLSLPPSFN